MSYSTIARYASALTIVALAGGCTMKSQDAPDLSGPSELGTSLTLTATPDTIPQDGATQAVVAVIARDAKGQPVASLPLRLDVYADGAFVSDFGRLSTQNTTTGSDGRATVTYTAPKGLFGDATPEAVIRIYVTPVGSNLDNATARSVAIRLVAPATIYVPGSPVASFSYSPSSPKAGEDVFFNASASTDPDGYITLYQWTYGDGDVEYGQTQAHDFAKGTYNVILTVTDNSGNKASTTRTITVGE